MRITLLKLAALLAVAQPVPLGATDKKTQPSVKTVCWVKNTTNAPPQRMVSITAHPIYDRHFGYHLVDPACIDHVDGTGMIRIEFPKGMQIGAYPKLSQAFEQSFLAANVGKRIFANCTGAVSYPRRQARFVLNGDCQVWSEE